MSDLAQAQGSSAAASSTQPRPPWSPREQALIERAWSGLQPDLVWDMHTHLLGTGDGGSGCRIHPDMTSPWHPVAQARRRVILDAAQASNPKGPIDHVYVQRLRHLMDDFPAGAQWLLLAFDEAVDNEGRSQSDWTTFYVPNTYAATVAKDNASRMKWVASVHPYRRDALQRLALSRAQGAVALKWLPSAMNINMNDPRCVPVYDWLKQQQMPLIVHCGEEHAVPGADQAQWGNPLLARAPLERGVKVIFAHCASLGKAVDTERHSQPNVPAFDLFCRLMTAYPHAMGDISAVLQINRSSTIIKTLLQKPEWQGRLLHGSDYPLPGVGALYAPKWLALQNLVTMDDADTLNQIRQRNPLMFDIVLKRCVQWQGQRFGDHVFHTARQFVPTPMHSHEHGELVS